MNGFAYADGELRCEGVSLTELAREVHTPAYVYSHAALSGRFDEVKRAFAPADPLICYSVKANGNLAVLRLFKERGAGFDVVSGGELFRTMRIDADPQRIVFAGVGKTDEELRYALRKRIFLFNVESEPELERLHEIAHAMGQRARVALRINPDVDPKTHRFTATGKRENKFGVDMERARAILRGVSRLDGIELCGLHMHIGSQMTDSAPYRDAVGKLCAFADDLRAEGIPISLLNLGGGFGIDYTGEGKTVPVTSFAEAAVPLVTERGYRLVLEPGRYIAGPAGALLTRVTYVKRGGDGRRFVIVDAGLNDLLRPALYGAHHRIWPVAGGGPPGTAEGLPLAGPADIVGPICESGDFFAQDRAFPDVAAGDLLAILDAGAYGFAMASQYNAHPRPPEVLVEGAGYTIARRRESYEDLVAHEL